MTGRGDKTVITNRKARHEYFVLDVFEAGMVLKGAEVKSIREGRANLQDSFVRVESDAVRMYGMHVSPYSYSRDDLDPIRPRPRSAGSRSFRYACTSRTAAPRSRSRPREARRATTNARPSPQPTPSATSTAPSKASATVSSGRTRFARRCGLRDAREPLRE